jgi:hypothetical protein
MKPLDVHALDMRNQLHIFQSSVERYFRGIGIGDLDNHDQDHEQLRIQVVKSVMGLDAATALIGLPDSDLDTYKKIIDVLIDRFAPADDDVHSLGLVQQCSMRDDETTKAFANRLHALVACMVCLLRVFHMLQRFSRLPGSYMSCLRKRRRIPSRQPRKSLKHMKHA